jgi:membrane protein implicated in regulation of membrane protease activity
MIWVVAAIVLAILEIFTPSFFALCLAAGALLGAITAGIGMDLNWQLLFFAIGSIMAFIFVRPVMMRYFMKKGKDAVVTGVDALIGRTGKVSEAIQPQDNRGRVAVDGDDWKAVSAFGEPIAFGEPVEIVRVDSATLFVKKS